MLAFEQVASLFVIELVRIPADQREIRAVVIRVTAYALLARACRDVIRGMQPALFCDARSDIGMAADALELRLAAAQLVTLRAMYGSVKKLMLASKRSRRNLRSGTAAEHNGH